MSRKTNADWARIIQAQASSGLTATEFCCQKKLNPKYFSLRKQRYLQQAQPLPFIEAKVLPRPELPIKLRWRELELVLPQHCDAHWLLTLMQGLQHEAG